LPAGRRDGDGGSPTSSFTTDDLPAGYTWRWGRQGARDEGEALKGDARLDADDGDYGGDDDDEATSAFNAPGPPAAVREGEASRLPAEEDGWTPSEAGAAAAAFSTASGPRTPGRMPRGAAASPGGLFDDENGEATPASSPPPSPREPSVFSLDGIQVGAFQCPFESMYFWICRRRERLVLLIDLGRSRVSHLETAWLRTGARLERSPFATGLYRSGSGSFAGCLAFEVALAHIEGWHYENALIGGGRLALEVSRMRRREFEDIPTAKLFYTFLGGLEKAAASPAVSRSVRERRRRQGEMHDGESRSWRQEEEEWGGGRGGGAPTEESAETMSARVMRHVDLAARAAMGSVEKSPLVSRLFAATSEEEGELEEEAEAPRSLSSSRPPKSRLGGGRGPAEEEDATPSAAPRASARAKVRTSVQKTTIASAGALAQLWLARTRRRARDGVLEARTVQIRFSDPHLPHALRALVCGESGSTTAAHSRRLLTMHESGIPGWALFAAGLGLPYRPWMRHRLRNLFVLLTLLSCMLGCYDLVARKLPLLVDLGVRLYLVLVTAIPLRWIRRGKLTLRAAAGVANVALGQAKRVALAIPVLNGAIQVSEHHAHHVAMFARGMYAHVERPLRRLLRASQGAAPGNFNGADGFIGPLPLAAPQVSVAVPSGKAREWGLGGTMWFWSPSLVDDARQVSAALWRACIEAWRSLRTVLSAVGMAVGSLSRHRQSLLRVLRDKASTARWWAWQHADALMRTSSSAGLGARDALVPPRDDGESGRSTTRGTATSARVRRRPGKHETPPRPR